MLRAFEYVVSDDDLASLAGQPRLGVLRLWVPPSMHLLPPYRSVLKIVVERVQGGAATLHARDVVEAYQRLGRP